jgi:predicted nucleotidyltransferase
MSSEVILSPTDLKIVQDILVSCLPSKNRRVFVFGSRAKGTTKRFADLDLAFDMGSPLTRQEQLDLADKFEESNLSYKVDIVDLHTVSKSFADIIRPDFTELKWAVLT